MPVEALYDLLMHSPGRTIDAFDNTHPDYSGHLTEAQAWNIVKFMREEWVKPTDLYDLEVSGGAMDPGIVTQTRDLQDLYAAMANPLSYPNLP